MLNTFRMMLIYSLIAGALAIGMTIAWTQVPVSSGPLGMPIGYLIMLVALSLIFVGMKQHRDTDGGGVIKFGRASLLGLTMALVSALVYILVWEAYLAATDYSFISGYLEQARTDLAAQDLTAEARTAKETELNNFEDLYSNAGFRLLISFTEIFPVGVLVALASAFLLKNPAFMPAQR